MYQLHGRSPPARSTAGPPAPAPGDPPSGAVRAGQIDTPARPPPSGGGRKRSRTRRTVRFPERGVRACVGGTGSRNRAPHRPADRIPWGRRPGFHGIGVGARQMGADTTEPVKWAGFPVRCRGNRRQVREIYQGWTVTGPRPKGKPVTRRGNVRAFQRTLSSGSADIAPAWTMGKCGKQEPGTDGHRYPSGPPAGWPPPGSCGRAGLTKAAGAPRFGSWTTRRTIENSRNGLNS